jgi:ceramide glucosyltransferase
LKPLCGLDPHFREAVLSHALQDYPDFEILFGSADPGDAALEEAAKLAAEFPPGRIRIIRGAAPAANRKVGVLMELAKAARYPLLLVNDSDIRLPEGYLRRIVAHLEDPGAGLVTCLYGARSDHWPGRWEALGIATDFAPSALVAPMAGVREFGLGAALLFRSSDLEAIGGFPALADYLADDYQLAARIARLGRRVVIARTPVETSISGRTWGEVWRHQIRWARTIRVSRPAGYAGLMLSNTSLWALVAALAGAWWAALPLLALRLFSGMLVGFGILRSRDALLHFYLIPFRDLWGVAVWACGLAGNTVEWRGTLLRLDREGRIVQVSTEGGR